MDYVFRDVLSKPAGSADRKTGSDGVQHRGTSGGVVAISGLSVEELVHLGERALQQVDVLAVHIRGALSPGYTDIIPKRRTRVLK